MSDLKSKSLPPEKESDFPFASLPGGQLVRKGLADLARGKKTESALLVLIGRPQLRLLGLEVPSGDSNPEHSLYDLLAEQDTDSAHSRYNALIRSLVSFERAAVCEKR